MGYVHHFHEEPVLTSAGDQYLDLSTTAVLAKGRFGVLIEPIIVLAAAIKPLVTTAFVTPPAVNIFWSTAGTTSTAWTGLATWSFTSGGQLASGYRVVELNQIVRGGEELIVYAKTTTTQAAPVDVNVYVRPYREDFAQNPAITVSG